LMLVEYFSITVSFSYSYSDKAPTFTMPTVKASIPDHTAVDTSVMDFFTDSDYLPLVSFGHCVVCPPLIYRF
jgi:hypothetical protein